MQRRTFIQLIATAGATALGAGVGAAFAEAALREIRIGYQKNGVLVVARRRRTLETAFAERGIAIRWVEFTSGPPMLEAMSSGSVDLGAVGDAPPIFAQAAGAGILYVAGQPITNGQGILVPQASPIRSLQDLKGRRIGFTKGSSAHNVVVLALERAGLTYQDITPVYLAPPDAGPAFANGSIDAWSVWDPYFAIGEVKQGGRILVNANELGRTNAFLIANRRFAADHGGVLREVIAVLAETARWAEAHRGEVAQALHEVTGVPLDIQTVAADRSSFVLGSLTDDIVATQQGVADRFHQLGLIPRPIVVRDIVWRPAQS